jgi:hypothetical protein
MKTSDQTSTFKVYKSHANYIYKNIEKDKIESAFVEFVKEKGEIGNDRYFNVKYKTVNGTDIFEFTRASTQPSPPLESTQPSNPREFGIFLNNYQFYDPNNPALFTISNANAKIIKDHQDKIRDGIILCPQGDNTITFHKDFIKAGLEDYVNEHGMPSHNLEISTVRDGKPIFKATGKKVNEGSQFIVELPNGSTLGEGPTFKEIYNLTIGNATYSELQMVDLQRRKTYFELQNEKIKNSLNSQIEIIEAEIRQKDINTISSFFATPDANTESSDQTSTTENENKIKELLTRVLATDEKETESEKTFNEKLKAYFVQMAKADMEKSFKSGKQSKVTEVLRILDLLIKDESKDTSINFAILRGEINQIKDEVEKTTRKEAEIMAKTQTTMDKARIKAEEIIRVAKLTKDELIIYDFFATPNVNPENATKIIELLTRVLTTHEKETESEKEIKKNLKAYFVEMAKAEMEELSEHEHSKLEELLRMPISNANVTTFIKSEIESEDLVNDLTLTKGIYIAKKAAIDNFFRGKTLDTKTNIEKVLTEKPESMEYFRKKLKTCSGEIKELAISYKETNKKDKAKRSRFLNQITRFSSIKNTAQEILTSAQEKITKKLVGDVFDSISPSGTQAPENLAEGAEKEKNVHTIKVFLSQLKSVIDIKKSGVDKTQADQNIEKIKDDFSSSLTGDTDQASKKFKIEFFNSLVDNLNNPNFVKKYQINDSLTDQPQSQLSSSFSQAFNDKTIEALTALSDSIKTNSDYHLTMGVFKNMNDSIIDSTTKEDKSTKNLVYSTIFFSLFLASLDRLESLAPAPASTTGRPSAEASGMPPAPPR